MFTTGVRAAPGGEIKDIDEGKRQALFRVPWEVIDDYNTDFARAAFDKHFAARLPTMCWQHDRSQPIGHTLEVQQANGAHEMVTQFSDFEAVPLARQAFVQLRDKDITDVSFGFDKATGVPHPNERGAIRFNEARMVEISPVTVGSIPGAKSIGVREAIADATGIAELVKAGAISAAEANRMLRAAGMIPEEGERESIVIQRPPDLPAEVEDVTDLLRDRMASVGSALANAVQRLDGVERGSLPEHVREALDLVSAADVAADELAEALGVGERDTQGQVGEYKARHLIRWFNEGAGGKIAWGSPGDLTACHNVAVKHMTSDRAWGFCNERHKDVLGTFNDPSEGKQRQAEEDERSAQESKIEKREVPDSFAVLRQKFAKR